MGVLTARRESQRCQAGTSEPPGFSTGPHKRRTRAVSHPSCSGWQHLPGRGSGSQGRIPAGPMACSLAASTIPAGVGRRSDGTSRAFVLSSEDFHAMHGWAERSQNLPSLSGGRARSPPGNNRRQAVESKCRAEACLSHRLAIVSRTSMCGSRGQQPVGHVGL